MRMKPLNELFSVAYGNKLDMNKMEATTKARGGVNFVGRSSQNHGVTGVVSRLPDVEPYPAGCITVSLGGSKLLSSFVQMDPFYTAQNVAVLRPKADMTFAEKLFVCLCIRHNRFRYSAFGREANRTLRTLPIPDPSEFPGWLEGMDVSEVERSIGAPILSEAKLLKPAAWTPFRLEDLFDVRKGKRLTQADMQPGDVLFIGAIDRNNGVRQRIGAEARHQGNVITVNYNGSVAEAFYQPRPFWASDDVNVLLPKFEGMDPLVGLFICTILRREKYRFNYGRKWTLERMKESAIRLPSTPDKRPDCVAMRDFMAALPFSAAAGEPAGAEALTPP